MPLIKPKLLSFHLPGILLACGLLSINFTPALADEPIKLSFGLYTSDKPTTLVKKFRPILNALQDDLSQRMGRTVSIKLSIARTYHDGIHDLVEGRVDFARFGPASYILAQGKNQNIKLLAMETLGGEKHFHGVICVRKDSDIKTVSDLKNRRFAFGSKSSTIGRYLSQNYLVQHGIRSRDLKSFEYLGRHDKVGYAVAQGSFDAGAMKEHTMKKLISQGQPLRKIARFENVARPWVAREGMAPELFKTLQSALYGFNNNIKATELKKYHFVPTTDKDYALIQQAIKSNHQFHN